MDLSEGLTSPTTHVGKVDPGDGPGIYYAAKWSDGVEGKLEDRFAAFRTAGFRCFRWDKPIHYVHSAEAQVLSIKSFIDSGECMAMVIDSVQTNDATLLLGYVALGTTIPIHYVGPEDTFRNAIGCALRAQGRLHFHETCGHALAAVATSLNRFG